jgi:hypothetical protein
VASGAAARTAAPEVRDPVRQASRPGADKSLAAPVSHCRRRQRGSPAENRHGGAPRGVPLATGRCRAAEARWSRLARATDRRDECACRRSARPSSGGRTGRCRRGEDGLARRSVGNGSGRCGGDTRQGKATTRAHERAAGTKKTALFDIVSSAPAVASQCGTVSASRRAASSLRSSAQIAAISGATS